ncbi:hypothetical protein OPT61_g8521 [Boeremia exigua]|uniref:Uncharacterized protein n=1 Tax=Boeremia exigua TaxID=749465 RepID=A0ACC2HXZ1_9PLEO|nr:hypothetical protein OPT61_g8521 [Boeremia exigua]
MSVLGSGSEGVFGTTQFRTGSGQHELDTARVLRKPAGVDDSRRQERQEPSVINTRGCCRAFLALSGSLRDDACELWPECGTEAGGQESQADLTGCMPASPSKSRVITASCHCAGAAARPKLISGMQGLKLPEAWQHGARYARHRLSAPRSRRGEDAPAWDVLPSAAAAPEDHGHQSG